MPTVSKETKNLAKKIAARREFLKKIVPTIDRVVQEYGRVLSEVRHDDYTNTVAQLNDFARFSFRTNFGQSMFGGNVIIVWYYPAGTSSDKQIVLNLYWQVDLEECEVRAFDEDTGWQQALLRLMKNKERVLARIKEKSARVARKLNAKRKAQEKEAALREEARRLSIH